MRKTQSSFYCYLQVRKKGCHIRYWEVHVHPRDEGVAYSTQAESQDHLVRSRFRLFGLGRGKAKGQDALFFQYCSLRVPAYPSFRPQQVPLTISA